MVDKIRNFLFPLPDNLIINQDEILKRRFINFPLLIGTITAFFFGILNVAAANYTLGFIDLSAAFFFLLAIIYLRLYKLTQIGSWLVVTLTSFLFLYSMIEGGEYGGLILWMYLLPLMGFFFLGKNHGTTFCLILCAITLFILFNPFSFLKTFPYQNEIKLRFLISFSIIILLARAYESMRQDFQEKMKNDNEKLMEREKRYRTLLDDIDEGYFELDLNKNRTFVNAASLKITGYSREELLKLKFGDMADDDSSDRVINALEKVRETGHPEYLTECNIIRKDGTRRSLDIVVALKHDPEGYPNGFRGISRDVTDRRSNEDRRRMLESQLHDSQKLESLNTIAAGVAHNFRNILAGISANSQLIYLNHSGDDDLEKIIQRIENSIKKGSRLVDGLLQFSHHGYFEPLKQIDISKLVRTTCDSISQSLESGINLNVDVEDKLFIMGNRLKLGQVIMEICRNSRDAMPEGGEIKVSITRDDDRADIIISDTGLGMNEETKAQSVDPFFTTKDVDKGTGLGLSSCYGIIKDHGGRLNVFSEENKGTTIKFFIPLITGQKES